MEKPGEQICLPQKIKRNLFLKDHKEGGLRREKKKSPFTHQITQAFFPYMLHTLLNTFLKLLRYSKYSGLLEKEKNKTKKRSPLCSLNFECLSPHSKLAQHEPEVKERNSLMS